MYGGFELFPTAENHTPWEQRFCPTDWCGLTTLYVQRDERFLELWHVSDGISDWLVAATAPVCPLCGGDLLTAANVMEGVDGVTVKI
jgi:hypothetical protein